MQKLPPRRRRLMPVGHSQRVEVKGVPFCETEGFKKWR
jgi:hypothetical protein